MFHDRLREEGFQEVAHRTCCHDVSLVPSGSLPLIYCRRQIAGAQKAGKMFGDVVSLRRTGVARYTRVSYRGMHTGIGQLVRTEGLYRSDACLPVGLRHSYCNQHTIISEFRTYGGILLYWSESTWHSHDLLAFIIAPVVFLPRVLGMAGVSVVMIIGFG